MKSTYAIALIAAAGLASPLALANDPAKHTQATTTTPAAAPAETRTERAKDATSDSWITTKVKAEFAKEKGVSATHIKVDTDHGVVNLSGMARSKAEADKAVALARDVKGVTSVNNNIQVDASMK